jgi:hypothetical protein
MSLPPSAFAKAPADRRSLGGGWSGGRFQGDGRRIIALAFCFSAHVRPTSSRGSASSPFLGTCLINDERADGTSSRP